MAICLDYQAVSYPRKSIVISVKVQVFFAVLLLASLVSKVWIQICTTDLGYQLAKERQAAVNIDMERRELELELSVLMRPDNLSELAKKRIGLAQLNPNQARKIYD